jgi:hypothetical protein
MYDFGSLIVAIRTVLPTSKLPIFEDMLVRAATSPMASDDFRQAVGLEPREPSTRKFEVITGGAA